MGTSYFSHHTDGRFSGRTLADITPNQGHANGKETDPDPAIDPDDFVCSYGEFNQINVYVKEIVVGYLVISHCSANGSWWSEWALLKDDPRLGLEDKNQDAITPGMQTEKEEITFFQEVERNAAIVATGVWGNDTVALWTTPKDIMFRFEGGEGFFQMNKTLEKLPFEHKWALFFKSRTSSALMVWVFAWDGTKMQIGFVAGEVFEWEKHLHFIEAELADLPGYGLQFDLAKLNTAIEALKSVKA